MAPQRAELRIAASHPTAPGHFPGNPVIPGAVLLDQAIRAIGTCRRGEQCLEILSAKFVCPVRPGDLLVVEWDEDAPGTIRFTAWVGSEPLQALNGVVRFGP